MKSVSPVSRCEEKLRSQRVNARVFDSASLVYGREEHAVDEGFWEPNQIEAMGIDKRESTRRGERERERERGRQRESEIIVLLLECSWALV